MFISGFIVAGLNYRFKWLILPRWIIVISTIIFLFAYVLYAEVLRENAYLSRIVEIQENQKVIDTGLYKVCLLYTSPSPRDLSTSRMPSSA